MMKAIDYYNSLEEYNIQKSLTFTEVGDFHYLDIIIDNFDKVYPHIGKFKDKKDDYKEIKDKKTILTILKDRRKIKDNTFTYKTRRNSEYGRIYPDGYSLCMMNKILRHTISKKYYIDVDIVNCHFVLVQWYCKVKDRSIPYINDYCNNRASVIQDLANARNMCEDDVKQFLLTALNNQNMNIRDNDPFYDFYQEIRKVQDWVVEDNKDMYAACKKSNKTNPKGSCISKFLQTIENKIIQCVIEFCNNNNIRFDVPCFDGGQIMREDAEDYGIDNLLNDMGKLIYDKFGIPIKFVEKPMNKDICELLDNLECSASVSSSGSEGEYLDLGLLSNENIGKFILNKLIVEENIYYHEMDNKLYCYDEKTKLYIIKKIDYLMTYISESAPLYMERLGLNGNLDRFGKEVKKIINNTKLSFGSTAGQSSILKQITIRLRDDTRFIDDTFDRIPYLFPIKDNKVVDFRTDTVRERERTDYFTTFCNVTYDQEVDIDEVKSFIQQYIIKKGKVLDDDDIVHIDMFLSYLGYCVTGYNDQKKIILAIGKKDTGKSTIFNKKLFKLFREFWIIADKKVICETKSNAVHNQELFPLIRKRVFSAPELDEDDKYNTQLLKSVSGDDKEISMRKCGGDQQYSGIIDGKIILPFNSCPTANDPTLMERFIAISFENVFKGFSSDEERYYIEEGINDKLVSAIFKYAHFFIKNGRKINLSKQSLLFTQRVVSECNDVSSFFENHITIHDKDSPETRMSKEDVKHLFKTNFPNSDLARHPNKFYKKMYEHIIQVKGLKDKKDVLYRGTHFRFITPKIFSDDDYDGDNLGH